MEQKYHWFFPNTDYQIIYELFSQYYKDNKDNIKFYEFINDLPAELANIATNISSLDRPTSTDEQEVQELIDVIQKENLENRIVKLKQQIEEYQKLGQKEKLDQCMKKLIELIRVKQQEESYGSKKDIK